MAIDTSRVVMEMDPLVAVPVPLLAEPYCIRHYHGGDVEHWLAIHRDGDPYLDYPDASFAEQFGTDKTELAARQLYLCHDGEPVGTASAWFNPQYKDGSYGRIHYVAIRKEHQGKGLARPLVAQVMQVMMALGHPRAYLTTQRMREVAIRIYASYGFVEV